MISALLRLHAVCKRGRNPFEIKSGISHELRCPAPPPSPTNTHARCDPPYHTTRCYSFDRLQQAEDKPVPANQLSGLLTPLHRQRQYANSETSHLLYDLLDDIRAYTKEQSKLLLGDGGDHGNRPLAG